MKIKVAEATDSQLDWLVASIQGQIWTGDWYAVPHEFRFKTAKFPKGWSVCFLDGRSFNPSTDWSQGGPIIEREGLEIGPSEGTTWRAMTGGREGAIKFGPTPLIAAMRCFCASKLGDTVEIPKELT